jgi:hypothetical protein
MQRYIGKSEFVSTIVVIVSIHGELSMNLHFVNERDIVPL